MTTKEQALELIKNLTVATTEHVLSANNLSRKTTPICARKEFAAAKKMYKALTGEKIVPDYDIETALGW
jgi:hypothetical protein